MNESYRPEMTVQWYYVCVHTRSHFIRYRYYHHNLLVASVTEITASCHMSWQSINGAQSLHMSRKIGSVSCGNII